MNDDDESKRQRRSAAMPPLRRHPIGTPRGTSSNAAVIAVGSWLSSRGLVPPVHQAWSIEIAFGITPNKVSIGLPASTSFQVRLSPDEWGYTFAHDGKVSTIRVGDVPSVHDRDDHQLLAATPSLKELGAFVRRLEQRYDIRFQRNHAAVRTSLAGAEPVVLAWANAL